MFEPRYKHYAAWPLVLWCRFRRHVGMRYWFSGNVMRCWRCGDALSAQWLASQHRRYHGHRALTREHDP